MKIDRVKRVNKKIRKFYEREERIQFMRIDKAILNDAPHFEQLVKTRLYGGINMKRVKGKLQLDTGFMNDDFIKNLITVRLTYNYPKHGNL